MNTLYSSQPVGSFQSSQIRTFFRRVSLLVWLFCLATTVNGQLYYVLNDGSASTRNDQFKKRAADGSSDSFIIDNFADSPGSIAIDRTNKKAFIIENRVTTSSRIYAINLTAATSTTFLTSTSIVTGLAVDNVNNRLYYTASDGLASSQNDYLRRINLDGTGDAAVGSGFAYSAGNIALDLANNRAFVADRLFGSSKIYTVNLSTGASSTFLIPTPPASTTVTVRGMAVDAANNYLYYAVSDNDASRADDALWRINLDGTGNTQLSTGNVYSMGDIALDKTNNRVYISDLLATAPRVAYLNLNNNVTATFLTPSNTSQVTGISFDAPSCPTSFIVNNLGDGTDANPGDGVCATSGGVCTLRAAMQEANALTSCPGSLSISFSVTGTINTTSILPTIARDLVITGPGASQLTVNSSGSPHQLFNGSGTITIANLAITNGSGGDGAAITVNSGSSLTVAGCALINNTAEYGAHIYAVQSSVWIQNSAITGNTATGGGGVTIDRATLTLINSTIANNDLGIFAFGSPSINLLNVTLANTSNGIVSQSGTPTITVKNSILANGAPAFATLGGSSQTITSQGNNLCTDASLTPTASGDLVNTNPVLAPLGYYGGSTLTRALLPGSPAINAGTSTGAPTTDQRGVARSGNTDIGAFESRGFSMAITGGNNQSTVVNTAFTNPLVVSVSSANSEPVAGGIVTYTGPGSGASINPVSGTASIAGTTASASVTANATSGGSYNVTASANGASSSVNFALTNTALAPSFTTMPTSKTVCSTSGTTFIVAASNATSYQWRVNTGSGFTNLSNGTPYSGVTSTTLTISNVAGLNGYQYQCVATGAGSTTSSSATLTVPPTPSATITYADSPFCKTDGVGTVTQTGTSGGTYTASPTGLSINASTGQITPSSSTPNVYTVTYTMTASGGCPQVTTTTSVTINGSPTAILSNNGPLSCTLTTVTLTASGGNSYTFVNSIGTVLAGTGNTRQITATGTYSVTVANSSGCVSTTSTSVSSNTATITVTNPTITTGTTGMSFTQSFTATGGAAPRSFTLASGTLPSGLSLVSGTGVLSGTPSQSGTFPITVRATDANGCSGTGATYTLEINNPTPTLNNLSASSATLCVGSPVTFTATVGNVSGSYTYTLANGTSTTLAGTATSTTFSQSLITTGSGLQTFTLTVASSGQTTTATTTLTVNTLPSLSVSPTSATLTNASPTTTLTATGTGNFMWSTGQSSSVISVTASGLYSVTLTNATGCSSTASVPVTGSDLTINLILPQASFATSGTASVGNFVVNVFEVGGLPTSSGNVRITISAPVGYTLSFPPSLTSIQVSGGSLTPINNAQWTVSTNLANRQLTLTMASGAFIGAGGESSLGFSMTRTSANSGSVSNITVNVADDLTMTYDGNLANNVYARIISGL